MINKMNKYLKLYLGNIANSTLGNKILTLVGIERLYCILNVRMQKQKLYAEAKKEFERNLSHGNFNDYKQALDKHLVSYSEYAHQYEFYKKSEKERDEFISRLKMRSFYLKYGHRSIRHLFCDKIKFLTIFDKYIHRKWIFVPNASYEEFAQLVSNNDCIVKPIDGSLGKGVFKIYKNSDSIKLKSLYESCNKNKSLVEECVESCEELKAFHPQSLNTIRVVTISNKKKAEVFGSFLRMGVGDSVVDNAHAGGIFAQINVKNGEIESDGINTNGCKFIFHPDSMLRIKGYKIPKWNLICDVCCEAALLTTNPITGWDVVINNRGNIEFIEGNSNPDFDVMQSPFQVGVKKKLFSLIKEYRGIDLK
ncbi:MAG: hypothetical protein E7098_00930 [Mediterranea massiliensis]|nr:hypothetical protein [Mediterranea massiliensis]